MRTTTFIVQLHTHSSEHTVRHSTLGGKLASMNHTKLTASSCDASAARACSRASLVSIRASSIPAYIGSSAPTPTDPRSARPRRASAPRTAANLRGGDTNSEYEGYETVSTAKCGRLRLRIRVLSSAGRNTRNSLRFWGQQAEQRLFTAWRVHGVG